MIDDRSYASALFDRTPEEIRMALDVYQQELNRLMQPPNVQNPAVAQFLNATSSNTGSANNNSGPPANGSPQDLSLPKSGGGRSDEECSERAKSSASKNLENGDSKNQEASATIKTENPVYMSHSLHNILRPSSSPSPDESITTGGGGVASPLQRIASITNSLMSQPSNPALPQVTQRPMKAILPPITQLQFDTYQNLNTEDIVKKVTFYNSIV